MNETLAMDQVGVWTDRLQTALVNWGPKVIAAVAILVIGYIIAKIVTAIIARVMRKSGLDETLVRFLRNIISMLLVAFVVIAALGKLGVDTTSLAAIFAAAGLAIGLALQGSLGNFASGVMLIGNRPFKVGDIINVAGVTGKVEAINVFATTMNTPDNTRLIVPNGEVTSGVITNFTTNGTRRIDMVFGIAYGDDIDQAMDLFTRIVNAHPKVLQDPAPQIAVSELADSSVNFVIRPWVNVADYWGVTFELTEQLKKACDESGLSIPFPQQDVYMHQVN